MLTTIRKHVAELRQEIELLDDRLEQIHQVNDVAGSEMVVRITKVRISLHRGLDKLISTGVSPKGGDA